MRAKFQVYAGPVLFVVCLRSICGTRRDATQILHQQGLPSLESPIATDAIEQTGLSVYAWARRLLQHTGSQLAQNISVDANSYTQEYYFFANTDLLGYDLQPTAGFYDRQLDQGVAACSGVQGRCCLDASGSQARNDIVIV